MNTLTSDYRRDIKSLLGEEMATEEFLNEFFKSLSSQMDTYFSNLYALDPWPTKDLQRHIKQLVSAHNLLSRYEYLIKRANTVMLAHFYYYIEKNVQSPTVTPFSMCELVREFKKEGK